MMKHVSILLYFALLLLQIHHSYVNAIGQSIQIEAIMPPFTTETEDEYLCTSVKLPDTPMKLVGIEPIADQSTVHHMLLFGCGKPANTKDKVWPCRMAAACSTGNENVMYGWGKNAPAIHLPDGSGFAVGPGTGIKSVVLQVHYLLVRDPNDASGVKLHLTSTPVPYSAGLIAYAASFTVPPGKKKYLVPNECCYSGFEDLHGFAFRVHTHKLGESVYLDHTNASFGSASSAASYNQVEHKQIRTNRVAEQNPQLPQGFYPTDKTITLRPGDRIKTTCHFNSVGVDHPVNAGHTSTHEMCNLYLMLYSELPFFMWCVDSSEWIDTSGAGGVPESVVIKPETLVWNPPARVDSVVMPSKVIGDNSLIAMPLGQVAGITRDRSNTSILWAFHRAFRTWTADSFNLEDNQFTKGPIRWPAVLMLDRNTGDVVNSWGRDVFYMPHMISLAHDGNLLVVDAGRHQLMKFSPSGEELMSVGEKLRPGKKADLSGVEFCKPTHAISARDGTLYVADGYCNGRIVKLSPSGTYLDTWNLPVSKKVDPLPHSLALDECRNTLYVADREVGRIHAINTENGDIIGHWALSKDQGLPYAVRIGPYGTPLALTWNRDGDGSTKILALSHAVGTIDGEYELPGVDSPHDFEIIPAPLQVTGVGERQIAVVVAETAFRDSKLRKFVLFSDDAHKHHSTAEAIEFGDVQDDEKEAVTQEESHKSEDGAVDMPAGLSASHHPHTGHSTLKPIGNTNSSSSSTPPQNIESNETVESTDIVDADYAAVEEINNTDLNEERAQTDPGGDDDSPSSIGGTLSLSTEHRKILLTVGILAAVLLAINFIAPRITAINNRARGYRHTAATATATAASSSADHVA